MASMEASRGEGTTSSAQRRTRVNLLPARPLNRQACLLLLLTATLVGSCMALAIRTLLKSGSGTLLLLLALGLLASVASIVLSLLRRHLSARRAAGQRIACCCIVLEPEQLPPPSLVTVRDRSTRQGPYLGSSSNQEQMELSVRTALTALPEHAWSAGEETECSLCMEVIVVGEMVRALPRCGHTFHSMCIDRWLLGGQQAHQRRRCPLCNENPVETVAITCPPGVRAGDVIRVCYHSEYDVAVPAGAVTGQIFHTNLPACRPSAPPPSHSARAASTAATSDPTTGAPIEVV